MNKQNHNFSIDCVDLFCGAGGLTHGLSKGGVNVRAGVDIDPASKFPYEVNNDALFIKKNINELTGSDLSTHLSSCNYSLLAGCAPCQPFSAYSQGKRQHNDQKWALLKAFSRLVKESNPCLVTMENVPQLANHPVFASFIQHLNGYHTWHGVVECPSYGIPQTRKRLVLLASRLGPIKLLAPTHTEEKVISVKDVIGKLPRLNAGESSDKDHLHRASKLSGLNLRRIRQSTPGGSWRDWDEDLVAQCHKKKSGKTYPSVYGRMSWNKPAPTITTQCFGYGNGRFGHPEQDRGISLREAAIFQTFPRNYQFVAKDEKVCFSVLGRLIGNAVPVRLGEVIAQSFFHHISEVESNDDESQAS